MRQILFRGKRIENGEWYVGSLHLEYEGVTNTLQGAYLLGKYSPAYKNAVHGYIEVDPETVSEFTGMLDRNGERIFEDDIVKVSSPSGSSYYAKIEYDCGCYWVSNPDIQIPDTINNFNMDFVVVEGNIFDNPELLGVYK